jgi:tRNA A58 N-methylase Trm61
LQGDAELLTKDTEGDIVLLKNIKSRVSQPVLTPVLATGKSFKLQYDSIAHDDIVGKQVARGLVVSRKKAQYRIHRPTLGEYTDNSPRVVTPV